MPVEVAIWRIDQGHSPVTLSGMDYERRLQEIIAADVSIVDPSLMVIGREVVTSFGGSIDILAIDAGGNLVVIELKRDQTPRDVVAQTLDYGSWISHVSSEEIAETFIDYQRRHLSDATPRGINEAFQERFNSVPDELNTSHRLLIVASEMDPSTERIVAYLRNQYNVDINVVLFRAFRDGERQYLTRAWLNEPEVLSSAASTGSAPILAWNGEYYNSFGEGEHRSWSDARKYGFICAGGGDWYVRTLRMLQPDNRVWVCVPGKGYVGVGRVVTPVARYDQFEVSVNGSAVPITEVPFEAEGAFDEAYGQHFVGVEWLKTVDLHAAVWERGFFANQHTVAQPRSSKWLFTVNRLEELWGIYSQEESV